LYTLRLRIHLKLNHTYNAKPAEQYPPYKNHQTFTPAAGKHHVIKEKLATIWVQFFLPLLLAQSCKCLELEKNLKNTTFYEKK